MWRTVLAVLLILVGCVLAPLSVVAVWARNQLTDTDRYVANVAPLAADPAIQNALADRITHEIFAYVDVDALVGQAVDVLVARGVPAAAARQLRGLGSPLADGVRGFVRKKVGEVVAGDTFRQGWVNANRSAHEQLVAVLSGRGGASVGVSDENVSVDLGAFVAAAKQSLLSSGFAAADRIPDIHPRFVLISSRDLEQAQSSYRLLDRVGAVLPFVAVGLIVLGIFAARGRRRALFGACLGVAVSMALLAIGLAIARTAYLDRLPADVSATAAATLFDTLVRFVRTGLWWVLAIGLLVALVAFLFGPSAPAVWTRRGVAAGANRLRGVTARPAP
jgi:hypothetical protein